MQVTLVVVEIDPQREPSETTRKIPCAGSFTIRRDVFDLVSNVWQLSSLKLRRPMFLSALCNNWATTANECVNDIVHGPDGTA